MRRSEFVRARTHERDKRIEFVRERDPEREVRSEFVDARDQERDEILTVFVAMFPVAVARFEARVVIFHVALLSPT